MVNFSSLFFNDTVAKQIYSFQAPTDFDILKKKFWKDIKEQDSKHNKWIGRETPWKGYNEMMHFHNNFLKQNKFMTTFEGMGLSIAIVGFKHNHEFHDFIRIKDMSNFDGDLTHAYGDLEVGSKCHLG